MNRAKSLVMFVIFLVCFYLALTVKYYYFTDLQDESPKAYEILCAIVFLGGIFLGFSLQQFHKSASLFRSFSEGVSISTVLFISVSTAEAMITARVYQSQSKPENFYDLSGHCGVSVGRTVLRFLHNQQAPTETAFSEFGVDQRCRLRHLEYVMKYQSSFCESSEDKIDCLTRWMGPVAEHGYWNLRTRKFFFDAVMKAWPQSKKDEALVNYALKDLELESGRQSILRQIGMDESLTERYLLMQEKDELDHLLLTKNIFETVAPVLNEAKISPPPPYWFKFKDTQAELQTKLEKIPELQKEIDQMIPLHQSPQ